MLGGTRERGRGTPFCRVRTPTFFQVASSHPRCGFWQHPLLCSLFSLMFSLHYTLLHIDLVFFFFFYIWEIMSMVYLFHLHCFFQLFFFSDSFLKKEPTHFLLSPLSSFPGPNFKEAILFIKPMSMSLYSESGP